MQQKKSKSRNSPRTEQKSVNRLRESKQEIQYLTTNRENRENVKGEKY